MTNVRVYLAEHDKKQFIFVTDTNHQLIKSSDYLGECGNGSAREGEHGFWHFKVSETPYKKGTLVRIDSNEPWNARADGPAYKIVQFEEIPQSELTAARKREITNGQLSLDEVVSKK